MLKILMPLAMRHITPNTNTPLHCVRGPHIRKMMKYGLVPICVTPEMNEEVVDMLYRETHGLYLLNGGDVDPSSYGASRHEKTSWTVPELDALEIQLVKRTLEDKKPILGICRGASMINVACGGTLIQHLPDLNLNESHDYSDQGMVGYEDLAIKGIHEVGLDVNSRIFQIIKKVKITVSSAHHQSIKSPGEELAISGRSPAGIVEVIEHRNPSIFCFGVQSHPEVFETSDLEPLYEAFSLAIKEW